MALTINPRLQGLAPSGIRRFSALAAATPGCVSLTLGEPGEGTPPAIRDRVGEDLAAGLTHYPPNNGFPWLREAIASSEAARGVSDEVATPDNAIATVGATEALFVALSTILEPGDEVIVPTPAFSLYGSIASLLGARVVELDTEPAGYQVDPAALGRAVTSRTKAVVLCSPNNPTGCVLDDASLSAVAAAARDHDLFVVCDDVYRLLSYDGEAPSFAPAHPELADRTLVVGSLSKPWAMTGWRMGWLLGPSRVMGQAAKVHQFAVSSIPAFVQHAGVEALGTDVDQMRESYHRRRDRVVEALGQMGLPTPRPRGAFYAFPDVREFGLTSEEFCERAIREAGVALVPGTFFGGEGHVRLSYACDDHTLAEGLARLARFVDALREGGASDGRA